MTAQPFGLAELGAAVREAGGRVVITPDHLRLTVYGRDDAERVAVELASTSDADLDLAADRAAVELVRQLPPYSRLLIAEVVA